MSRPAAIAALLASAFLAVPSAAVAATRVSLPAIERQVMCVTCKIPLDEAESPQAAHERAFIRGMIEQGRGEAQIKSALVAQYGPSVLALPRPQGFNAAVYIVPLAVVLALAALLALLLPSWRRRARARGGGGVRTQARELNPADAARLDADMARFD